MSRGFSYRTRGGAEVPIAFDTQLGIVGVIPTLSHIPAPTVLASAQSLQKYYPVSKVLILGSWDRRGLLAPNVWIDSWNHWVG